MLTDIYQDLHDARTLLEQSGTEDEKKKYRKAAEIILLKALRLEPENTEANVLLKSARAKSALPASPPPKPTQKDVAFDDEPALFKSLARKKKKNSALRLPIGLSAVVVLGGGLLWMLQSHPASRVTTAAPVTRTERLNQSNLSPAVQDTHGSAISSLVGQPVSAAGGPSTIDQPVIASPTPVALVKTPPTPVANPVASSKTTTLPAIPATAQTVPTAMGNLALSSPTVAEIYQNGQHIGSTPTTLQLPPGEQTLEYRHGDLHTVMSHDIKPNETTAASVTFQITVQINAKPWAQVFLDGATRRPLGQTPLSGISVPIGGTLVFENPNFAPKTYRIKEKDTAIQLNFP